MNKLIDLSRHIPAPDAAPTLAYAPLSLVMKGRLV